MMISQLDSARSYFREQRQHQKRQLRFGKDRCLLVGRLGRRSLGAKWVCVSYIVLGLFFFSFAFCLFQIQVRAQQEARPPADSDMQSGIALAQTGDFKGAELAFQSVVIHHPNDPFALTALGEVQDRLGKSREAAATFRKVIALNPLSAEAHENLGISLADSGQFAVAREESLIATKLAPRSASAHFLRGRVLSDLGERVEARNEFRTVMELAPDYAEALFYWAQLEGDEGNTKAQGNLLKRYVELRPDRAAAFVELGHVLHEEHQNADAIAAWRHAIALDPKYADAIYSLARALIRTDPSESKHLMQRLADLERDQRTTDRIDMLGNRANAEMGDGNFKGAISDLTDAITLCGRCELLQPLEKNLGLAYCYSGQLDFGERTLKIAESLRPDDASVKEALEVLRRQRTQALRMDR